MAGASLRWGRIVLGGILAECILVIAIIPMRMFGSSEAAVTNVAVAGSFVVFVPIARWLGRAVPRPLLHGVLMSATAVAFYTLLGLVAGLFVADAPPTPPIYYVAHALKLAGGALGGRLAARSGRAAAATAMDTA